MIVNKYNTSFEVCETINKSFWEIHYTFWENKTFDFLFKYLNKEKTFLDIGSWIGPISLVASRYSKNCICYEPDELAYSEFSRNIEINNIKNIILQNSAVSIHKEIKLGADELGTSITREDCDQNSKTYNCISIKDIFSKYNLLEKEISVLKIDIEGHESELLQDTFLWDLNVPMHISLHPGWKSNKQKYYQDIMPFFNHKKTNIFDFGNGDFFDVEVRL